MMKINLEVELEVNQSTPHNPREIIGEVHDRCVATLSEDMDLRGVRLVRVIVVGGANADLKTHIDTKFQEFSAQISRGLTRVGVEAQVEADRAQQARYRQSLAAGFYQVRLRAFYDNSLAGQLLHHEVAKLAVADADALIEELAVKI